MHVKHKNLKVKVHLKRQVIDMKIIFELEFEVIQRCECELCREAMRKLVQSRFENVMPALFGESNDDIVEFWKDGQVIEARGGQFYNVIQS